MHQFFNQADALLFGRVTYEMMEAAFRPQVCAEARPEWMEPFARTIDAAKKYVMSSTLDLLDWNAELVRGDLKKAVQKLKREPDKGLLAVGLGAPESAHHGATRVILRQISTDRRASSMPRRTPDPGLAPAA